MKNKHSKIGAVLANFAIISALFSSLLYLQGRMFHEGYLSAWGIPSELFAVTIEENMAFGFLAYTFIISKPLSIIALCSLIIFEMAFFVDIFVDSGLFDKFSSCRAGRKLKMILNTKADINYSTKEETSIKSFVKFSRNTMVLIICITMLFLFVILFISNSGKRGEEFAKFEIEKYSNKIKNGDKDLPNIYLVDSGVKNNPTKSYIVTSNKEYNALFDGKQIIIVPSTKIDFISITPNRIAEYKGN